MSRRNRSIDLLLLFLVALVPSVPTWGQLAANDTPSWWDFAHAAATDSVVTLARRLDGFFGDPRALEDERAYEKTQLRIRATSAYDRLDGWDHGVQLRLRLPLPLVERRLRLVVDGRDDAEQLLAERAERFEPLLTNNRRSEVGLDWGLREKAPSQWVVRVSSGPKVSLRYRQSWMLTDLWRFEPRPQLYWHRDRGLGALVGADLLRPVGSKNLLRFSIQADEWGSAAGSYWRVGADWSHIVDEARAWNLFWTTSGVTEPQQVTEHRLAWRWRASVWRSWFFYEVEPSIGWRREALANEVWRGPLRFDPAVMFRIEVALGKGR